MLGFIGMAGALISYGLVTGGGALAAAPVLAFVLYGSQNFFSQAGPGSVSASGVLGVELAPTKVRGTVQALTVASGRLGATLTAFVFPFLIRVYGESFAVYFLAGLAVLAAIVTVWVMPETKRRSLEQSSGEAKLMEEESLVVQP
nr:MFS transporter [Ferrimicrobium sp.]